MSALMPCPFCGGPADQKLDSGSYGYTPPSVRVGCKPCDFYLPAHDCEAWNEKRGHYSVRREAYAKAESAWNRRAGVGK